MRLRSFLRTGERGSASLEAVIVLPAVLALTFLGVQYGLIYEGRTAALGAAQEGARVAAAQYSSAEQGIAAARSATANTTLKGVHVSGSRGATEATVVVTARVNSVIPGVRPRINQSASMPIERITG